MLISHDADGADPVSVGKVAKNYFEYIWKREQESLTELFISLFVKVNAIAMHSCGFALYISYSRGPK